LAAAAAVQPEDELRPHRVTYLLEAAAVAAQQGDSDRALQHLADLERRAAQIRLALARPDQQHLDTLRQTLTRTPQA
jgi:hypothetical protein